MSLILTTIELFTTHENDFKTDLSRNFLPILVTDHPIALYVRFILDFVFACALTPYTFVLSA